MRTDKQQHFQKFIFIILQKLYCCCCPKHERRHVPTKTSIRRVDVAAMRAQCAATTDNPSALQKPSYFISINPLILRERDLGLVGDGAVPHEALFVRHAALVVGLVRYVAAAVRRSVVVVIVLDRIVVIAVATVGVVDILLAFAFLGLASRTLRDDGSGGVANDAVAGRLLRRGRLVVTIAVAQIDDDLFCCIDLLPAVAAAVTACRRRIVDRRVVHDVVRRRRLIMLHRIVVVVDDDDIVVAPPRALSRSTAN